ncbi:MAG: radical SAM protein [Gemmatimonadota bacterium]|nr:radical SAM protein [Gemmatimonadota bacterium]
MSGAAAILLNPPNPPGYVSNKDSMGGFGQLFHEGAPPFPPLDLPYLAGALAHAGMDVEVVEAGAMLWSTEEVCERLRKHPAVERAVVVVRTSLPTIDHDLAMCATIREQVRPGRIVLYGAAVKPLLHRIKQDTVIDAAITGEPDKPVLELLEGKPLSEIAGLTYRDGQEWRSNPDRPFDKALDAMPFPRWDLLPFEKYTMPRSAAAGVMRFLPMLSSRGCPFGCNYCPYPVGQGLPWRHRSPANVVDEMEHIVRTFGVEYVIFRDPLFSANKKRVAEICAEIVRRGVKVTWRCETRIDCLDEATIALMASAGCTGVNFGVESSDPEIQKNVERKPITEAQFVQTIGLLRKYKISTFAFFVVGLPGDTVDTILASIRFALKLGATWTQFTVATPFIGTKLHDWAVSQGFIAKDRYTIVSSHEGSMGNENLTPQQVHLLHRFGQVLARNVLNRRGVLKNDLRHDPLYSTLRGAADLGSRLGGRAMFTVGSAAFRLMLHGATRGPATKSPRRAAVATTSA